METIKTQNTVQRSTRSKALTNALPFSSASFARLVIGDGQSALLLGRRRLLPLLDLLLDLVAHVATALTCDAINATQTRNEWAKDENVAKGNSWVEC